MQPVVAGRVADFASIGFTLNDAFPGDHRMDVDNNGENDAVSLNTVAGAHDSMEFYSPQAEPRNGGQDGLGLTNRGIPLVCPGCPFFVDGSWPLPAQGGVTLTGEITDGEVRLTLTAGLESASITGYHVVRVLGTQRTRVNDELILAQGGEGNTYALVDGAARGRGQRTVTYLVETVHANGAPTTTGPFTLRLEPEATRRSR